MHDGTTSYSSIAYLLLIIGPDSNIKEVTISASRNICLAIGYASSELLSAAGKTYAEAEKNLHLDINRRADTSPLWAWFKHKLG